MEFLSNNIVLQAPEYLWAILAVPLLWWLLRLIPPEAIRRRFPSLKLLQNLPPLRAQTAFTPIWLLILRGILIIALVLAFTDPIWEIDEATVPPMDQPIILLIDNCWAAAPNWLEMQKKAKSLLSALSLQQNIALLAACPPTANHVITQGLVNPPAAILQMQQLRQRDVPANWRDIILALQNLDLAPIAQLNFISSGVMDSGEDLQRLFKEIRIYDDVNVILPPPNHLPLNLTISQENPVTVTLRRLVDESAASYQLNALNQTGKIVSMLPVHFMRGETEKDLTFSLLPEEFDKITRIQVQNQGQMANKNFQSDSMPSRIGLVSGQDEKNSWDNPQFYLLPALSPSSEIIKDSWQNLLSQNLPVIITTDSNLPADQLNAIASWINRGGRLIRFADTTDHFPSDNLLPAEILQIIHSDPAYFLNAEAVKLWDIPAESPLHKMTQILRDDFNSYWLMSPAISPQTEIWASYNNGAPMVAARRIGSGLSIFITAAPVPVFGKWMTNAAFPELMQRLASASSAPENYSAPDVADFESLALLNADTLPSSMNISDLGMMAQNINLAPYLLALALILFVMDQSLILLRFSGMLWARP